MKKHAFTIGAVVIVAGFLAVSSVRAQTKAAPRLTATVPFEFGVGDRTLPAGEYTVSFINPASPIKVLQLRRKEGGASVVIQTSDVIGRIQDNARLVFHRYDDRYFLAQAWMPANSNGLMVQKSRAERTIERNLAGLKARTATVALNVKR